MNKKFFQGLIFRSAEHRSTTCKRGDPANLSHRHADTAPSEAKGGGHGGPRYVAARSEHGRVSRTMLASLAVATLLVASGLASPLKSRAASVLPKARSFPVTVVDDLHNKVHLARRPRRILSLDPRDTETLFALGLESRVVADGSKYAEGAAGISRPFRYPSEWPSRFGRDYPLRSKTLTHIEGGFGTTPFDLETIEKLHPDLILALNSDQPTLQKMRTLGLKVLVLDPASLHGIVHDIQIVGRATGTEKQGRALTKTMKQQLFAVQKRIKQTHVRPRVYYEIDATNPAEPYTAGPKTFIDEAIHIAGAHNVADSVTSCSGTTCYPQFSLESLVRLDPQFILLGDAAYGTTVESVKNRTGWSTIAAVQTGRIYPFNDELISRAGPRIVIGILKLARRIHPEAFR